MRTSILPPLSCRDRAVLRAIAANRCTIADDTGSALAIDGLRFCDQFAGVRLMDAGLVTMAGSASRPRLTDAGRSILAAA